MTKDLNEVHLIGTLSEDVIVRTSSKGNKWISCKIITNYYKKKEDGSTDTKSTYHSINAFGETAEKIGANFRKGSRVDIIGVLSYSSYVKDNVTKWATNITIRDIKADETAQNEKDQSTQNNQIETPPIKKQSNESSNSEELPF